MQYTVCKLCQLMTVCDMHIGLHHSLLNRCIADSMIADSMTQYSLSLHADGSSPLLPMDLPPDVESINNIQGIFPRGCQWRDLQHEGQTDKKFWAKEEYEYWHGDVKHWKAEMPETCTVRGPSAKQGYAYP